MSADRETRGGGAAGSSAPAAARDEAALTDEDFYMDGPYLVFTAAYHLKRGYCCGSGCRNCPYAEEVSGPAQVE